MTKEEAKDTVKEAFAQAEKYGSASIPLPRENAAGETTIDTLRVRGTPIELIHSYFLADKLADANAAFRTSLLENIYERLALIDDLAVAFKPLESIKGDPISDEFKAEANFTDDAQAALIRLIEELSTQVDAFLSEKMTSTTRAIYIIPDDCETKLQWLDGNLFKAEVDLSFVLS